MTQFLRGADLSRPVEISALLREVPAHIEVAALEIGRKWVFFRAHVACAMLADVEFPRWLAWEGGAVVTRGRGTEWGRCLSATDFWWPDEETEVRNWIAAFDWSAVRRSVRVKY